MTSKIIKVGVIAITLFVLSFVYSTFAQAATVGLKTYNTVNIQGAITSDSVQKVKVELLKLDTLRGKNNYPIYLVIDSPGGSIYAGNSLLDVIESVKNVKTITYFAASMASAIVQQTKGERLVVGNAIMMFHRASGSFRGQFEDGEVEQQLKLWKAIVRRMEQANADRMKMSLPKYKKLVKDEYWLTSKQSLVENAADRRVVVKCSAKLIAKTMTLTEMTFLGPVEREVSACPAAR